MDRASTIEAVAEVRRYNLQLQVTPVWYVDFGSIELRAELALWRGDRATLTMVERRAKRMLKKKVAFAHASATSLRAGVAARRRRFAEAALPFEQAARAFDHNHMKLNAAACRLRQGEILSGQRGARLIEEAELVLREEEVVEPERFAHAMYAPRFPLA